jgi:hypothetical protein
MAACVFESRIWTAGCCIGRKKIQQLLPSFAITGKNKVQIPAKNTSNESVQQWG